MLQTLCKWVGSNKEEQKYLWAGENWGQMTGWVGVCLLYMMYGLDGFNLEMDIYQRKAYVSPCQPKYELCVLFITDTADKAYSQALIFTNATR